MPTGATALPTMNRLCVKGRFGFDYMRCRPQRLTKPLIRLDDDAPKSGEADQVDAVSIRWTVFREATWEEALDARRRTA